ERAALPAGLLVKMRESTDWGPRTDPSNPEATGSGRVHAHLCPAGVALALGADGDSLQLWGQRWTEYQSRRGCNYRWSPLDRRSWIVGRGYAVEGGGFGTLYSARKPAGMYDWPAVGRAVPNAQHMTIDALVWYALGYGSFSAAQCAAGQYLSVASFLLAGEYWPHARNYGWFAKASAYMAPLLEDTGGVITHVSRDDVMAYLKAMLDKLERANYRGCPVVDNGKTSEGGHLTFDDVKRLAEAAYGGRSDQEIAYYARSCNSWMTAILGEGLSNLLDIWEAYGWWEGSEDLRKRVVGQLKLCGTYFLGRASQPALDVKTGQVRVPKWGMWDDVAPAGFGQLGEGGDNKNWPVGLGARFLVGPLYATARHFGDRPEAIKLRALAQPIIEECKRRGWWGTGEDYAAWVAEAGLEVVGS
ncbi:hypothetical protein DRQ32_07385, partial [bacterium]